MSTLAFSYSEPYKLPAGVLALVVHGAFFALLYFGVNWHSEPPQGMVVDIWDTLPAPQIEPVKVEPPPVPQVEPPKPIEPPKLAEPVVPPKADIALPDKKQKIKPSKPAKPVEIKPVQPKKYEPVQVDKKVQAVQAAQDGVRAAQDGVRAAQTAAATAAITNAVGKYKGLIIAKIRRNIVMPPDVPDNVQAEFDVILIPGGTVLSAKLTKPSGNGAYDEAVERAISKAQPLPLPPDVSLFNRFRELHLTFRPKEIGE
jgi:colicin import membrane protein